MAKASFTQSNFLSGEWSPQAAGRIDDPNYVKAMTLCRNALPIEEASWIRRSGTREMGATLNMKDGIVREFVLPNGYSVYLEFTYNQTGGSNLRFWGTFNGEQPGQPDGSLSLIGNDYDSIVSISTANPAVLQTTAGHSWITGDTATIYMQSPTNAPVVANRQFVLTVIDSTHVSLTDMLTGQTVDGATLGYVAAGNNYIVRAANFFLPYDTLADLKAVKLAQAGNVMFLTHQLYPTIQLALSQVPVENGALPLFAIYENILQNQDGPYLDPPPGLSQTYNGLGSVQTGTLTPTFQITDGSYSFVASDLNRLIRIIVQPPAWNGQSDFPYSVGDLITYDGAYYQCLTNISGGLTPPNNIGVWELILPNTRSVSYGYITEIIGPTSVVVQLINQMVPEYNGNNPMVVDTYQLGVYTVGQYASCGSFHEGRLWLGGALPGRFDASCSGFTLAPDLFTSPAPLIMPAYFSPTDTVNGVNVVDSNAIGYSFQGSEVERVLWIEPDHNGLIFGTSGGEWLIQASNINNILTPTSIQAHQVTRYKCADTQSVRTGLAIVFVQALGRRVMEYLADAFTQRFSGRHLNEMAKHLTTATIRELAYQEELSPTVWGCCLDGSLIGCTYRRVSQFATEMPLFTGWHKHGLGSKRTVTSLTVGGNVNGQIDTLVMMTQDSSGRHFIEQMQPLYDADQTPQEAWLLDSAVVPIGIGSGTALTLHGMWSQVGQTVTAEIAGLNCGQYTVQADGSIVVPYGSDPNGFLTEAYMIAQAGVSDHCALVSFQGTVYSVPMVIGQPYLSVGQLLRPQTEQQVRTQTGPGVGKPRRVVQYGVQFANTICGVGGAGDFQIGTNPANLRPLILTNLNGTALDQATLFDGIWWDVLDDDWGFDSMIYWQISNPYPVNVLSVTGFMETSERT